jgi:ABC-type lipoprotein export system ATPase subunit/bifunctional DNA-binding transcriptional regulator/antitoxin component of YhaV-PrlF toxin-antitoxin module
METSNVTPFISLDGITKNYEDPASSIGLQALRGVDLELEKGSLSAIIGPSGSGKSTLMRIIGGLIKPTTGKIFVNGTAIHLLSENKLEDYRKQVVGFLWQDAEQNLFPDLSMEKNIMLAMAIGGFPKAERKNRTQELVRSVGLSNKINSKLGQLSGGEAQRAGLAVALANDPKLLLADEPTGELDIQTTNEVMDYLQEVHQDRGTTILIVTHDGRIEKMMNQSFRILDGYVSDMRISSESKKIRGTQGDTILVVNKLGFLKIPAYLREKYMIGSQIKFEENDEKRAIYIRDWDSKEGKNITVVNKLGLIKLPDPLRERYDIKDKIRIVEDEEMGEIYIVKAEESE